MNRIWLREYEKLLSSNRREKTKDIKPKLYDSLQTSKPAKTKKKKRKEMKKCDQTLLATHLLKMSVKDEYVKGAPEESEKMFAQTKQAQLRQNNARPYFKPIKKLSDVEASEAKRSQLGNTGDLSLFEQLYPPIDPYLPLCVYKPNSPERTKIVMRDIVGTIARDPIKRPQSSPMKRTKRTPDDAVQSFMDDLKITRHVPYSTTRDIPEAVVDNTTAQRAQEHWNGIMDNIWQCGNAIEYGDVVFLSTHWTHDSCMQHIVMYLCTLLGLKVKPNVDDLTPVVERSLFKELLPLVKYFREMNPLAVPARRLRKATTLYTKYLEPMHSAVFVAKTPEYMHNNKFLKWVHAVQKSLNIVLQASVHQSAIDNDAVEEEAAASRKRKEALERSYTLKNSKSAPGKTQSFMVTHSDYERESSSANMSQLLDMSLSGVLQIDEIFSKSGDHSQQIGIGGQQSSEAVPQRVYSHHDSSGSTKQEDVS